jgi:hypothetical protein
VIFGNSPSSSPPSAWSSSAFRRSPQPHCGHDSSDSAYRVPHDEHTQSTPASIHFSTTTGDTLWFTSVVLADWIQYRPSTRDRTRMFDAS